jgi:hypothetical protein
MDNGPRGPDFSIQRGSRHIPPVILLREGYLTFPFLSEIEGLALIGENAGWRITVSKRI